ncbi:MAG TPA: hypothetical protein VJ644_00155 [Jiangellaceae bacterium]|nr:hypothetical protein [Jiangellaceae bacterium]
MRQAFAHDAVLVMEADADLRAPCGAVTAALCGHWDHEPPCPLAPHHSRTARAASEVHVRILFAAEQGMETTIRQRIESALSSGQLHSPDGVITRWQLRSSRHSDVRAEEMDHAERLIRI